MTFDPLTAARHQPNTYVAHLPCVEGVPIPSFGAVSAFPQFRPSLPQLLSFMPVVHRICRDQQDALTPLRQHNKIREVGKGHLYSLIPPVPFPPPNNLRAARRRKIDELANPSDSFTPLSVRSSFAGWLLPRDDVPEGSWLAILQRGFGEADRESLEPRDVIRQEIALKVRVHQLDVRGPVSAYFKADERRQPIVGGAQPSTSRGCHTNTFTLRSPRTVVFVNDRRVLTRIRSMSANFAWLVCRPRFA